MISFRHYATETEVKQCDPAFKGWAKLILTLRVVIHINLDS